MSDSSDTGKITDIPPGSFSIMLVDDTPANLQLLSYILMQDGYDVRTMPDGEMALASVIDEPPDLILLDIRMPGLDGYQVCDQLKADPATRHIPVIFISALNELEDKVRAFAAGGVDYITKPFQQAEVLARVRAHLYILRTQRDLEHEVARRTAAEYEASRQRELLTLIDRMRAQFINQPHQTLMFEGLLTDILTFTESAFGFIGELQPRPNTTPRLLIHALSNIAWNAETRALYEQWKAGDGLLFDSLDNLFGHVATSGQAVIANQPSEHPAAHGLPEGHPAIDAFLGVPLYFGNELIGLIGLANRSGGYRQALVDELQPLLAACAQVMAARREQRAREKAEEELRERELQLRELTENIRQVFWMSDRSGEHMLYVSPVVEALFACSVEQAMAQPWLWRKNIDAADRTLAQAAHASLLEKGSFDFEYRLTTQGTRPRWIRERAFPVHDERGAIARIAGLAEDVSALHLAQEQIWHQATHDGLTDLCNRKLFNDRLTLQVAEARRMGESFALFYLDLDDFKRVNDTHGHALGDQLLIEVANRLRGVVRESDTLARLGGDEFAIMMPSVKDQAGARGAAERIITALVTRLTLNNQEIDTSCSIGIAFYPAQGKSEEALLRAADQAMYLAKGQTTARYALAEK